MDFLCEALLASGWSIGLPILAAGLVDLTVDVGYLASALHRHWTIYRHVPRATAASLPRRAPRPAAILIPAWDEEAVIGDMLRRLRASLDDVSCRVFLGVYANDPATAAAARRVDPEGRWLEIVRHARHGPTTKADCLNAIWQGVLDHERRAGTRFDFVVMHDAEDLPHRDELRIFAYLIDRAAMVQLPVIPVLRSPWQLVAGHYLDEFAESHGKELVLRERFAGAVPSAGVGCAIARHAMDHAARTRGGRPFCDTSLTEDYAFALDLARRRERTIFVRLAGHDGAVVGTRSHFPDGFGAAVRQKARWFIGIALQGWAEDGWHGPAPLRLALLRDRLALGRALLGGLAYLWTLCFLLLSAGPLLRGGEVLALAPGESLGLVLAGTLAVALLRAASRCVFATRLAGPRQGLMSLVRIPVANAINFCAACRALWLWGRHRVAGLPLRWDKTAHEFPLPDLP